MHMLEPLRQRAVRNTLRRTFAVLVIGCLASQAQKLCMGKEIIKDSKRGFALTVPEGFVARADLQDSPEKLHVFHREDPEGEGLGTLLIIRDLGALLDHDWLKREPLSDDFKGSVFKVSWNDLEMDAIEAPVQLEDASVVEYDVPIPLKPAAIQVVLVGPSERKDETKALLSEILKDLKGQVGWMPAPSGAAAIGGRPSRATLVGVVLGAAGFGFALLWLVSKVAPRGVVLGVAILIWLSAGGAAKGGTAEAHATAAAMSFVGVVGSILGIVDLLRKRAPKRGTQTQAGFPVMPPKNPTPP